MLETPPSPPPACTQLRLLSPMALLGVWMVLVCGLLPCWTAQRWHTAHPTRMLHSALSAAVSTAGMKVMPLLPLQLMDVMEVALPLPAATVVVGLVALAGVPTTPLP